MPDLQKDLSARVQAAYASKIPLNICAGGTKSFLGRHPGNREILDVTGHSGIIEYDPSELVLVARAGTQLAEVEAVLASHGQMLGFEPPFAANGATLGGAVAAGLAGPRRAYSGAVRDFLLGVNFINGKGEIIASGGKVMKNVAGFDLFRPMARSMGTLGVMLKIALRLAPLPELEKTLLLEARDEATALDKMQACTARTQAVSAAAWDGHNLRIRLSGSAASIDHGRDQIGGDFIDSGDYWQALRDFKLDFFQQPGKLWRISVAPMSGPVAGDQPQLIDWGGAQRWLKSDSPAEQIRKKASQAGGHAECFTLDESIPTFHPMPAGLQAINQRFKDALDPAGILNPGRLW